MSDASDKTILTEMRITLARIEERQVASDTRTENIEKAVASLVSATAFDALSRRVSALESSATWTTRTIVAAAVGAVASLYVWGKQKIGSP